jgi:hypothetical protein
MLTPQDLQNLAIILSRAVYNGLDEAKIGVVLENKLKGLFEAATAVPPAQEETPK